MLSHTNETWNTYYCYTCSMNCSVSLCTAAKQHHYYHTVYYKRVSGDDYRRNITLDHSNESYIITKYELLLLYKYIPHCRKKAVDCHYCTTVTSSLWRGLSLRLTPQPLRSSSAIAKANDIRRQAIGPGMVSMLGGGTPWKRWLRQTDTEDGH